MTDDRGPSRRQLAKQARRDAGDRSSDLARTLMTMKASMLAKLELDEDLRDAIAKARAITSQTARRRAERALAGELRRYELAELEAQLQAVVTSAEPVQFHLAEEWRERLLADEAAAAEFPGGNVEPLPTLVAKARSEAATGKPPGAKRALFRHIVAVLKGTAASVVLLVTLGCARPPPPTGDPIDRFVREQMRELHIPGLALAVVRDGQARIASHGIADLEQRMPVTTDTTFNLMSISKSFTALATMSLVEDGTVALDDAVALHLRGLPVAWQPITIRQLLTHTSGIPSFASANQPCPVGKDVRDYTRDDVWKEVACLPLEFAPGEQWAYGDTGYYLLGMLVERVSGYPYGELLRARVLDPLGMPHTRTVTYDEVVANRAVGYVRADDAFKPAARYEFDELGVMSTITDMARFEQAFVTDKVLGREMREQMWMPAVLTGGERVPYGFGLGLTAAHGRPRFGHAGGTLGFATAFTHFPAERVTIVVLANVELPRGRSELANEIAALMF